MKRESKQGTEKRSRISRAQHSQVPISRDIFASSQHHYSINIQTDTNMTYLSTLFNGYKHLIHVLKKGGLEIKFEPAA